MALTEFKYVTNRDLSAYPVLLKQGSTFFAAAGMASVFSGDYLFAFGGNNRSKSVNSLYAINPSTLAISALGSSTKPYRFFDSDLNSLS